MKLFSKKNTPANNGEGVGGAAVTMAEAKAILGNDMYGPEEISQLFVMDVDAAVVPPIPYSLDDIMLAKKIGELLMLRIDKDADGMPLTMAHMETLFKPAFEVHGRRTLFVTDWFRNEPFFTTETPRPGWKLVGKDVIATSVAQDQVTQTRILRDYLQQHGMLSPEEAADASDEKLHRLRTRVDLNWQECAKELSNLKMNLNHRRRPVEVMYDITLTFLTRNQILLPEFFDWTLGTVQDGATILLGVFDKEGIHLGRCHPQGTGLAGIGYTR